MIGVRCITKHQLIATNKWKTEYRIFKAKHGAVKT